MSKLYLISVRKTYVLYSLIIISVIAIGIEVFFLSGFFDKDAAKGASLQSTYSATDNSGGKLAIVIDDFGQSRAGVQEMMQIDRHLTFAIMPFLEFSRSDAETAYERGHEVIVHLPMEPNYGKLSWLGPRPIMAGMSKGMVEELVRDAFEKVPYAVGANIHMGSKASSDPTIIDGILDIIKEKNLYFVDSRTAAKPICKKIADTKGVRCFERDIFIDEGRSKEEIKKQLQKCEEVVLKKGMAIAVGHVGTEGGKATANAILEMLPEFDSKNIQLVFVSELPDDR